jgi:hypothetical protein
MISCFNAPTTSRGTGTSATPSLHPPSRTPRTNPGSTPPPFHRLLFFEKKNHPMKHCAVYLRVLLYTRSVIAYRVRRTYPVEGEIPCKSCKKQIKSELDRESRIRPVSIVHKPAWTNFDSENRSEPF